MSSSESNKHPNSNAISAYQHGVNSLCNLLVKSCMGGITANHLTLTIVKTYKFQILLQFKQGFVSSLFMLPTLVGCQQPE